MNKKSTDQRGFITLAFLWALSDNNQHFLMKNPHYQIILVPLKILCWDDMSLWHKTAGYCWSRYLVCEYEMFPPGNALLKIC